MKRRGFIQGILGSLASLPLLGLKEEKHDEIKVTAKPSYKVTAKPSYGATLTVDGKKVHCEEFSFELGDNNVVEPTELDYEIKFI